MRRKKIIPLLYRMFRPLLFSMDAEQAHHITQKLLNLAPRSYWQYRLPKIHKQFSLPKRIMGIDFLNPIGLAAGYDKNAECLDALACFGFGFVEIGTVVPKPQSGNPRPRVFRIPQAQAIINRMGFNSKGVDYVQQQLKKRPRSLTVGVNIGKNMDTAIADAGDDYNYCLQKLYPYADYFTLNISSPNTPDLRKLGSNPVYFRQLLEQVKEQHCKLEQQHGHYVPLLVKLSPDEEAARLTAMANYLVSHEIDGVIISNTTACHDSVTNLSHANEPGGLSGKPLAALSNQVIALVKKATAGRLPIIGVGGIMSHEDAALKISAGADLLQLYSGLVYQGPQLISDIYAMLYAQQSNVKHDQ